MKQDKRNQDKNLTKTRLTKEEKKQCIIEAAKALFVENGFQNTSIRDIAKKAEINLSLVNYYFDSKEALFDLICTSIFEEVITHLNINIPSDNSACENIAVFVDTYTEELIKNHVMIGFVYRELSNNPEKFKAILMKDDKGRSFIFSFLSSIQRDTEKGLIKKIDQPFMLLINIVSMCIFPFISQAIMQTMLNVEDEKFVNMMRERKHEVIEIFQTYLLHKPTPTTTTEAIETAETPAPTSTSSTPSKQ